MNLFTGVMVLALSAQADSLPRPVVTPVTQPARPSVTPPSRTRVPPPRASAPPSRASVPPPRVTISQPQVMAISPRGSLQIAPDLAEAPPLSQRPLTPLDLPQVMRLQTIQRLRTAGQFAAAHDSIEAMLATAPHHPLLLGELSRIEIARGNWAAVERLARAERASQHDSLLLGRDLAQALEQLKRPREAAAIVLECWQVRPAESDWAVETINRLTMGDTKAVRELVRKTALTHPDRVDFQSAAAALDWKMGDGAQALKSLAAGDRPGLTPPLRWRFAEALLKTGAARDSGGAAEALLAMAGDGRYDESRRMLAARRVMDIHRARGTAREGTPGLHAALKDIPPASWNPELLLDVARGLREAGQTSAARALLDTPDTAASARPRITLERALDDLHEGPPEAALARLHDLAAQVPEARFRFAEALFFAGQHDSALAEYKRVSADQAGPFTGAAFDRMYLIEDGKPSSVLPALGRLMYLDWRGDTKAVLAAGDSLYQSIAHGPLWARMAVFMGQRLDAAGQPQQALVPLLALAEQLPDDRLAPQARQLAGDIYLFRLKQDSEALLQYEECLTRYPRAWNSAEVRRRMESIKKRRL